MSKEKGAARRFNEGKRQWDLVDFKSLEPMVEVLEFGSKKYAAHEWQKGQNTILICNSLMRHLMAFMNGEDNDPESKLSHIGHIQCNAMFLNYMLREKKELDDRAK